MAADNLTARNVRAEIQKIQAKADTAKIEADAKKRIADEKKKSLKQPKELAFTFGFNIDKRRCDGMFIYNCNRLIRMYEKVGPQLEGGVKCAGIVGVVDVPYLVLEPTHNKQDFADSKEYKHLLKSMAEHMLQYWKDSKIESQGVTNFWDDFGYTGKWRDDPNTDAKFVLKRAMSVPLFVQCDSCLKWRQLQFSKKIVNMNVPDDWICALNPDPNFKSCSKPEQKSNILTGKLLKQIKSTEQKAEEDMRRYKEKLGKAEKTLQLSQRNKSSSAPSTPSPASPPLRGPPTMLDLRKAQLAKQTEEMAISPPPRSSRTQQKAASPPPSRRKNEPSKLVKVKAEPQEDYPARSTSKVRIPPPKPSNNSRSKAAQKRPAPKSTPQKKAKVVVIQEEDEDEEEEEEDEEEEEAEEDEEEEEEEEEVEKEKELQPAPTKRQKLNNAVTEKPTENSVEEPTIDSIYQIGSKVEAKVSERWYSGKAVLLKQLSGGAPIKIKVKFDQHSQDKFDKWYEETDTNLRLFQSTNGIASSTPSSPLASTPSNDAAASKDTSRVSPVASATPAASSESIALTSTKTLVPQEDKKPAVVDKKTHELLDGVCNKFRRCLHYFRPPDFSVTKEDILHRVTPQELKDFPLSKFVDDYERNIKKLVGNQDQQKSKDEIERQERRIKELDTENGNKDKKIEDLESKLIAEKEDLRKLRLNVNIMIRNILQGGTQLDREDSSSQVDTLLRAIVSEIDGR